VAAKLERPAFASRADYAARFTDVDYWRPYVAAVCARHGLALDTPIRAGLPGTHPVFLVADRYAVKFTSPLFSSPAHAGAEAELYARFAQPPALPVPKLVVAGDLFPADGGWPWPYLITTLIPGRSFGEDAEAMDVADQAAVATYLGPLIRTLHEITLPGSVRFAPTWDAFAAFLERQRAGCLASHRRWGSLPDALIAQIEDYLLPLESLLDLSTPPSLIHADLTADHVLGRFVAGHWQPTGLIDFDDARVGAPGYEWVALHLDLFRADKALLRAFFAAYGADVAGAPDFAHQALSFTLLHEFDVLGPIFAASPALRLVPDLPTLAALLWDSGDGSLVVSR
jgi:hygromycin-B 7''-O-kinase